MIKNKNTLFFAFILLIFLVSCGSKEVYTSSNDKKNIENTNEVKIISHNNRGNINSDNVEEIINTPKSLVNNGVSISYLVGRTITTISNKDYSILNQIKINEKTDNNIENALEEDENFFYFVANTFNFEHSEIALENKRILTKIDKKGNIVDQYNLEGLNLYEQKVFDIKILGTKVFILVFKMNEQGSIYSLDLNNSRLEKTNIINVTAMGKMGNNLILASRESDHTNIYTYNYVNDELVKTDFIEDIYINNLSYNDILKKIYILSYQNLYVYDLEENKNEYIYTFPQKDFFGADLAWCISSYNNKLFALLRNGNYKVIEDINGIWNNDSTLTVLASQSEYFLNMLGYKAYAILSDKYPNFKIKYLDINEYQDYDNELSKKIMAKDSDFDIFIIGDQSKNIIEQNVFLDLSQFNEINKNLEEMLPGIKNLCSVNKKIFGVPYYFDFRAYTYDIETLEKYKISIPNSFISLSEYKEIFKNKETIIEEEENFDVGQMFFLDLFKNINLNIFSGKNIETDDIKYFYEEALELYKMKALANIEYSNSSGLLKWEFDYQNDNILMLPLTDIDKYPVGVSTISINPNSKKIDLAKEFLTLISSKELEVELVENLIYMNKMMMGHSHAEDSKINEEHLNEDNLIAEEMANIKYLFERETMESNKGYQIYKEMLSKSLRNYRNIEISSYAMEQFVRLVKNEINIETASDNLYKKIQMVINE